MRQDVTDYQVQLHALTQFNKSFLAYSHTYRGYNGVVYHASHHIIAPRSFADSLSHGINPSRGGHVVSRHRSTQVAATKGYNALMVAVIGRYRDARKNTGKIAACLDKVDELKPMDSFKVLTQLSPFCETALQIAVCERQPCVARFLDSIELLPDCMVVELLEYVYKCPISLPLSRTLFDEIPLSDRTIFQIAKDCGLSRKLQARMQQLLQKAKHRLWKEACRKFFVCGARNIAEPSPPVIDDELVFARNAVR